MKPGALLWGALAALLLAAAPGRAFDFEDVTAEAGIGFVHANGAHGSKYVIETVGAGAAFFDYDNDGDLDAYLVNGASVPGGPEGEQARNALYRNEGDGTFSETTTASGTGDTGYGMGCTVGDVDNDGDLELYLANFGANVFYRNEGDGTFVDITAEAGVGDGRWGSSCAFADVDLDGYADLYVANYHDFSYENHKVCAEGGSGLQLYCGPEAFNGVTDVLYRNLGDGTFADITAEAGLESDQGKELGVIFGDVDWDGDTDLYLANDKTLNFLFINEDGVFSETGLLAGTAYNEDGDVEAGMGVDMGDADNDGWPDLFVTNFQWETNTFYRNLGDATFVDETFSSGLGKGSIPYLSWGTKLVDLDNDGYRDVFIANGHLESDVEEYENTTFAQRNQVFLNNGDGTFAESVPEPGTALDLRRVSRGAAFGDYDGDGAVDILVNNIEERATLLRNAGAAGGNWLQLHLVGGPSNAAALGTRVELASGDLRLVDEVRGGGSYLSQNDLRLHFGLGARQRVDRLVVRWPSGAVDELTDIGANRLLTIKEGGA